MRKPHPLKPPLEGRNKLKILLCSLLEIKQIASSYNATYYNQKLLPNKCKLPFPKVKTNRFNDSLISYELANYQ